LFQMSRTPSSCLDLSYVYLSSSLALHPYRLSIAEISLPKKRWTFLAKYLSVIRNLKFVQNSFGVVSGRRGGAEQVVSNLGQVGGRESEVSTTIHSSPFPVSSLPSSSFRAPPRCLTMRSPPKVSFAAHAHACSQKTDLALSFRPFASVADTPFAA